MSTEAGTEGGATETGLVGTIPMTSGGEGNTGTPAPADGGGGDGAKLDIKAILGDELAADRNISKFLENENPVQAMAKSLLEAQKMAGRVKIGIPGEQSTPEEKATFYKELGVPDKPEDYEFTKPEGVPDEAWSDDNAAKWSKLMKEHNVPKAAAAALRQELFKETFERVAAANGELDKAMSSAFGEQKQVIAKEVGDLMQKAIPDEAVRKAIDAAISDKDRPAFALALGHVLQHMKKTYGLSDTNAGDGGGNSGSSIEELRSNAQKLMASPAYRDGMHKDHADTVKRVNEAYAQIGSLTENKNKK